MILFEGVHKDFMGPSGERLEVLSGINLSLPAATTVAIVGPSGSGKSTFLSLLAGLDRPSRGQISIDGERIDSMSESSLSRFRAQKLGFVFQSFQLLQNFSAVQNVKIAAEIAGKPNASAAAAEALEKVGLASRAHHLPTQLSGGECQRVAIARAIVTRPRLILADEPTGSLDPANADNVFSLLLSLTEGLGSTLVLVTHDLDLASQLKQVVRLERGRILETRRQG